MEKVLACHGEGNAESYGKDEPEVRMLGDGLVNVHSHNKMHHFRLKKVMNELVNHPGVLGGGRSGGKMKHSNRLDRICV